MKKTFFRYLPWLFMAACFAAWAVYFICHLETLLDADMASEMMLAHLLKTEKSFLLTDHWYYSTEIRTFHLQALYSLLFYAFDSWRAVRILSTLLFHAFFLFSLYDLLVGVGCKRVFPYLAGALMLPFSEAYAYIVLFSAFYIPYMILMFLILATLLRAARQKISVIRWMLLCILSFISGINGPRLVLLLFIPVGLLAFACALGKRRMARASFIVASGASCAAALAGFAVNIFYLSKKYSFQDYTQLHFAVPSLSSVKRCMADWIFALSNDALSPFSLLAALLLLAFAACLLHALLRREYYAPSELSLVAISLLSAALITLVYFFTDMHHKSWYYIPTIILLIASCAICIPKMRFKRPAAAFALLLMLFTGSRGYRMFEDWRYSSKNVSPDMPEAVEFLLDNGYAEGYCDFWCGNVLTEHTNGCIQPWCMRFEQVGRIDRSTLNNAELGHWLQPVAYDTRRPQGKAFLMLMNRADDELDISESLVKVFSSETLTIYDIP